MADPNDRYRAPALDKGLDILELLAGQPHGLTRAEIVKAMGRSPGEIYRMLERLVARHYVMRSPQGDRYALSLKLFELGHRHPPVERLVAQALPAMEAFAQAAEQSCHLGIYHGGNLTVVAQANGPGNWGLAIRLGVRVSLLGTGSGHVVLAFQPEQRRAEMLAEHEALEGEVPVAEPELQAIVERIRTLGYWQGESQQAFGVIDISMPIRGLQGNALAVLTCPFIRRIDRHVGPSLDAARQLLAGTAGGISID
ncbi:IclR family transcriptional regulator [Verminephrobacter aporrectodeae]|uniref:IclR family transcriptional regulator n=1 Tax=Verminephrobacter aporrectodeae subsp. tuberculatae TaxID=1110392 RepID=A0ABT3KN31_9BURK|nr:IclR family transcriptional regulator [Verminephrobacter aporrectodeae]MCW5221130.1 IclR family transcriptional regulator [Verminephrobacter aporrectodeae subsp. tuberculatae]MCW5254884.1 IclR family transcriptional regulator [Verminephrobacter aporrectodeae subsp. tuberculatae]MCW5290421.1 IclR family transcriptional regulator [Verminephrobacter aporrectodeae subsp. tuberculatae]MCW5319725.1 IclR family transcriptional regulator [Verminephrobacter aporrectodeae subsp. tuberculatae]MCW81649